MRDIRVGAGGDVSDSVGDRRVVVGLDLGTSALKGVAVDESGCVVGHARAAYETRRPVFGAAEQEVADWLVALRHVVAELDRVTPSTNWEAIGLSSMIPTLVARDGEGSPVGPAVTYEDQRAEPEGAALVEAVGARDCYEITGQRVDGRYLLPMFGRLRRCDPDRTAATRSIAGAKDQLFWYLTGQLLTDPSTAAGYGCFDLAEKTWSKAILDTAIDLYGQIPSLPDIEPSSASRRLRSSSAEELGVRSGLPIILGAADSVLGTYAVGARQSGEISYLAGTSTVILGVSEEVVRDRLERCIVTALQDTNGIGLEMDLLSTGSALAWLSNVLGLAQVSDLVPLAASADPATSPVFLPYLAPGEQGALWDSAATAAVVGVHLGHNREDIARALLSGLVIESRRCLGVLDELIGSSGTLYLSGPTASGPPFVQDLADATGREIVVCDPGVAGHSALGAAIFAAGVIDESWPQPSAERVATVQPDPAQAEVWRGLVARHESARVALSGQ